MFPSISRLFLVDRWPKSIKKTVWGAMAGFATLDPPLGRFFTVKNLNFRKVKLNSMKIPSNTNPLHEFLAASLVETEEI